MSIAHSSPISRSTQLSSPLTTTANSYILYLAHRRDEIRFKASGAAQPIMNKSDFGNLMIDIPILGEQRAIAAVLSALDDKIELNRRMNETLEASARALFRDWFVDFGPPAPRPKVARLSRARSLVPLPPTASRRWRAKRMEWSTIGEKSRQSAAPHLSTKDAALWDGGIAWTTPKDLSDLGSPVCWTQREQSLKPAFAHFVRAAAAGTVLMSSRAPVGFLAIASVPLAVIRVYRHEVHRSRLQLERLSLGAREHGRHYQ